MELLLIQDSLWFAAALLWLLTAVLARGVPASTTRAPWRRHTGMAACVLLAAAALVQLFFHDAGEPAHLIRADWFTGGLMITGGLAAVFGPQQSGWVHQAWRAGLAVQVLAWPAAWLAAGVLPPLAFTDILPWGTARSILALTLSIVALTGVWRRRPRPARRRHLVPAWLAIVIVSGAALAEILAASNRARTVATAEMRLRSLAFAIDAEAANSLTFDERAHESPGHRALRAQLLRLRRANPDIAYLYLAALHDGHLVYPVTGAERFLRITDGVSTVVSESDEPFELGAPVDTAFTAAFQRGEPPEPELTRDPYYGVLLTILAPIAPPDGGEVRAMLGMDYRVQTYLAAARRARRLAQLLTLGGVMALLLFLRYQISGEAAEADRAARAEADQRERVRNEFIGMVSHELQTPVHAILAHAHTLGDASAATAIEAHAGDLQRLVEDLLQASALQNPTFRLHSRRCALPALLREVAESAARRADAKGLAFDFQLGSRLPAYAVVDALRFRQIVVNLLSNAVKYTPHGTITFSATRIDLGGKGDVGSDDCTLELIVADTGPGLPAGVLSRLGEPFFRVATTAAQHAGAGLGLAVTRALCTHMGGELTVRSNEPHGTIFSARVHVRLATGEEQPAPPASAEAPAPRVALVVEDHPTLRIHLARQLEELGCTVRTASSIAEATTALQTEPPVQLLLVDQNLPDALGVSCIPQWRASAGRPWIIGISASRDPAVADSMLAAGADDFLYKPVSLQALREALAQIGTPRAQSSDPLAEELTVIRAAVLAADWPRATTVTHHLLNSIIALQLGEERLARARSLEDAVKAGDAASAGQMLDLLS